MANKIGWCDITRNYVWGCTHGCTYCYAREIAKRFASEIARKEANYIHHINITREEAKHIIHNEGRHFTELEEQWAYTYFVIVLRLHIFYPTFLSSHYAQSLPKKPQRIFLNSMSDIADWKPEWYEKILQKVTENFQHTFIILTKRPEIYKKYTFPHNVWIGVSMTNSSELYQHTDLFNIFMNLNNKTFVSIEPIHGLFDKRDLFKLKLIVDWLIIGPETGNRKKEVKVTSEMINRFYNIDIPVYMKSACSSIIDTPLRQEWPEDQI